MWRYSPLTFHLPPSTFHFFLTVRLDRWLDACHPGLPDYLAVSIFGVVRAWLVDTCSHLYIHSIESDMDSLYINVLCDALIFSVYVCLRDWPNAIGFTSTSSLVRMVRS